MKELKQDRQAGSRGLEQTPQGGGTQFSEGWRGEGWVTADRAWGRGGGGGEALQAGGQRCKGPGVGMSFEGQEVGVWPAWGTVLRKGGDPMGTPGTCTA